jgi:hypothetical protein
MLAGCVVTKEVWFRVLELAGLQQLMDDLGDGDVSAWWLQRRLLLDSVKRRGFDSLVLLVSWEVWKERNARIHDEGSQWIDADFTSLAAVWAFFDNAGIAQTSVV